MSVVGWPILCTSSATIVLFLYRCCIQPRCSRGIGRTENYVLIGRHVHVHLCTAVDVHFFRDFLVFVCVCVYVWVCVFSWLLFARGPLCTKAPCALYRRLSVVSVFLPSCFCPSREGARDLFGGNGAARPHGISNALPAGVCHFVPSRVAAACNRNGTSAVCFQPLLVLMETTLTLYSFIRSSGTAALFGLEFVSGYCKDGGNGGGCRGVFLSFSCGACVGRSPSCCGCQTGCVGT